MTDTILLTVPSGLRGAGVIALVLGGLGSRLDLPVDRIDELALAVGDARRRRCRPTRSSSRPTSSTTGSSCGSARSRTGPRPIRRCAASSIALVDGVDGASRGTTTNGSSWSSSAVRLEMIVADRRAHIDLLEAYRRDGDRAARDRLVEEMMPLVHSLARRYAGRGEPVDDLVQVGAIGLIKAIDRFELERGVELSDLRGADDRRRDPPPLPRPLVERPRAAPA